MNRSIYLLKNEKRFVLNENWFWKYVIVALGSVRHYYVAKDEYSGEIELLERATIFITDKQEEWEAN